MRGKIGIVVGLAAGYVLGSRAGRERYEQIKAASLKLWNTPPVQKQVVKAKELGKSAALALPSALWDGAVKVTRAAGKGSTPGQKLDSALKAGRASADDVARGAEKTAAEVKKAADKAVADAKSEAKKVAGD
ncbi:hypothetical protein JVX92_10200 [Microbacterium hominis]|uniref:Uncharacterized protein n=1 Tax=Microbacterium hominis TaxID=162426 RepID=A0A134DIK2_9MICO|nr:MULTISPECIES: hypothetical protein [Microbacterium]AUG28385.1 hypothetical protein CXR34_02210 [Microbacterium hominis]KXC06356.1 hypothetical protein MhomT_05755 [Microbacterium hominis]QOC27103.1 hypothetical protein IC745_06955 [Microbacterium hominis]QOC28259.1 hypothetical protein IC744_12700 [Microbacterium hominis]QRY39893.1 hypothetical protein JVX92_10200 [Microbacterium hominis]